MDKEKEILEDYRILTEGGEGEIVEKKSRFIATFRPVDTEEEAVSFIEEMKKKYWDARHNCSAFVLGPRAELTRCSDDGEPSGTAGRPMFAQAPRPRGHTKRQAALRRRHGRYRRRLPPRASSAT